MLEKYFKPKEDGYTQKDLEKAEQEFAQAEEYFNSFDLGKESIDIDAALRAKIDWEKKRDKYWKIYNILNSKEKK